MQPASDGNGAAGGRQLRRWGPIVAVVAVVAIIGGIVVFSGGGGDDEATSDTASDGTTDDDCPIDCTDASTWPDGWSQFEDEVVRLEAAAKEVAGRFARLSGDFGELIDTIDDRLIRDRHVRDRRKGGKQIELAYQRIGS